jgi:hypothetical protein
VGRFGSPSRLGGITRLLVLFFLMGCASSQPNPEQSAMAANRAEQANSHAATASQKAEQASAEAQAASVRVQRAAKDVKATADRIEALSIKLMAWLHAHSRHRVGRRNRHHKKPKREADPLQPLGM